MNREAIEQGYAYYQKLYQENPEFWWMGFAYSAVANSIYPAFLMLEFMADTLEALEQKLEWLPPEAHAAARELLAREIESAMAQLGFPPEVVAAMGALVRGGGTSADVRAVSQEFVRMQHDIFMDMGAAHYAYEQGGIELIRQMVRDGEISEDLGPAFELLDEGRRTGDQTKLADAARLMAEREQLELIQKNYEAIAALGEPGRLLLDAMSVMAVSPIPGGPMMREVVPEGHIDDEHQRMQWINSALDTWASMSPEGRRQ